MGCPDAMHVMFYLDCLSAVAPNLPWLQVMSYYNSYLIKCKYP